MTIIEKFKEHPGVEGEIKLYLKPMEKTSNGTEFYPQSLVLFTNGAWYEATDEELVKYSKDFPKKK